MKHFLLIVFSIALLAFLLIPSFLTPNENQATEATGGIQIEENNTATEPSETTIQTEGNDTTEDDEYDDCGEAAMAFHAQYTIEDPPMSHNRRTSVIVESVAGYGDIMHENTSNSIIEIHTSEGVLVNRFARLLYVFKSDTVVTRLGRIHIAGNDAIEYYMRDGDYVFTLETDLISIKVQYVNMKYTNNTMVEKELYYNLENVSSVRLEVSNYITQEVRCFVITEEGETEIFPEEQP